MATEGHHPTDFDLRSSTTDLRSSPGADSPPQQRIAFNRSVSLFDHRLINQLTPPSTPERANPYLDPDFEPRPATSRSYVRPRKYRSSERTDSTSSNYSNGNRSTIGGGSTDNLNTLPADFYYELDNSRLSVPAASTGGGDKTHQATPDTPRLSDLSVSKVPLTPQVQLTSQGSSSALYRLTAGSMESIYSVFNGIRWFYNEVNPSTLTGAIDVVVVEQPDGSMLSTPFHVRFGKYGVLHSREKIVDITINGELVPIQMKLGETGEAYFVDESDLNDIPEYLATSPLPGQKADTEALIAEGLRRLGAEVDKHNLSITSVNLQAQRAVDLKGLNGTGQSMPHIGHHHLDGPPLTTGGHHRIDGAQFVIEDLEAHDGEDVDKTPLAENAVPAPNYRKHSRKGSLGKTVIPSRKLTLTSMSDTECSPNSSRSSSPEGRGPLSDSEEMEVRKKSIAAETRVTMTDTSAMDGMTDWKWGEMPDTLVTPTQEKIDPMIMANKELASKSTSSTPPDTKPKSATLPPTSSETTATTTTDSTEPAPSWSLFSWSSKPRKDVSPPVEGVYLDQLNSNEMDPAEMDRYLNPRKRDRPTSDSSISSPPPALSPMPRPDSVPSDPVHIRPDDADDDDELTAVEPDAVSSVDSSPPLHPHLVGSDDAGYNSQGSPARHLDGRGSPWSDHGSETRELTDVSATEMVTIKDSVLDGDSLQYKETLKRDFPADAALSLCGYAADLTSDTFYQHLITYEAFQQDPMLYMNNSKLVLRMDGRYHTGRAAHAMLFSRAIFQRSLPETSLKSLDVVATTSTTDSPSNFKLMAPPGSESSTTTMTTVSSEDHHTTPPNTPNPNAGNGQQSSWSFWRRSMSVDPSPQKMESRSPTEPSTPKTPYIESDDITQQDAELIRYVRSLRLSSDRLKSLNLKSGQNECEFSVTTRFQGTTSCVCHIYLFHYTDKVVISDIDGTITKSDVLGHILPRVGAAWEHAGVAELFCRIASNGYRILYLSSRAIGMSTTTKSYLRSVEQDRQQLPDGPILLSPTSLLSALHKEVIEKRPEEFKMACLKDVQSLFPEGRNPFYAGFGNRVTDVVSYKHVDIPMDRILTINPSGELSRADSNNFRSSYKGMATDVVDYIFPPLSQTGTTAVNDLEARRVQFSNYTYWRNADFNVDVELLKSYEEKKKAAAELAKKNKLTPKPKPKKK